MAIKSELQWQAEDDARKMARYQEIISDKARLKRATTAARKESANLTKRANAMAPAAKGGRSKNYSRNVENNKLLCSYN